MSRSAPEIQEWMLDRLARLTGMPPGAVDAHEPVRRYGLDSVAVVAFVTDLEEWVGYRFDRNPLDDHPTVAALATFLAAETAGSADNSGPGDGARTRGQGDKEA